MQDSASPQHLGKYLIHEELGRGGFGTVYRATDTTLDRVVALKILDPLLTRDPGFLERFRREAIGAARLEHPNIVPVYEVGEAEGRSFIAMKYLPGRSLDKLLAEGRLPIERTLHILAQVAAALDFAHAKGVIHRDVKPSNVIVGPDEASGDPDHATLTDFGLARASDQSIMTSLGQALGTPAYMAPEQLDVDRQTEVGPASDIYSFAVVVYEMLAGRPPFVGPTPAVMVAHLTKEPPAITQFNADLSPTLWDALAPGLMKEVATRPANSERLVSTLRRACETADRERAEAEAQARREAEAEATSRARAAAEAQAAARHAEEERLQRERTEAAARKAEDERLQLARSQVAAHQTVEEEAARRRQVERDRATQRDLRPETGQQSKRGWWIWGAIGVVLVGVVSAVLGGTLGGKPTPQVVEKVVTQIVEKEVEKIVTRVIGLTEATVTPSPAPATKSTDTPRPPSPPLPQKTVADDGGIQSSGWPFEGHDAARTRYNSVELRLKPPLRQLWMRSIENYDVDSITATAGKVAISGMGRVGEDNENRVYLLDASTGQTLWTFPLVHGGRGAMSVAPAFGKRDLFFGGQGDSGLYAVALENGALTWELLA